MKFMETLTRLVVGTSRFGDHLLRQKVRGIVVAALAFACGAGLAYALKREPRPSAAPASQAPVSSQANCAASAPPAAPPAQEEDDEYDWGDSAELQEWKNRHGGTPLPLDYAQPLEWGNLSESEVVVLPSGRRLAAAGYTLYMLGADNRVVWKYEVPQVVIDFAYVEATGMVYVTAGDNFMCILDAATGRELAHESRNGSAAFGRVIPYGRDACLVMDAFGGYRAGHTVGALPMQDGVTAWRGTQVLWRRDVPPDAELQVVGSKVYAVTKTKSRILLKEIQVPQGKR